MVRGQSRSREVGRAAHARGAARGQAYFPAASALEASVPVEVLANTFVNRDEYHRLVVERIRSRPATPGIVFLDPDTGLESRVPSLDHVLDSELADLWTELKTNDVLVFYRWRPR